MGPEIDKMPEPDDVDRGALLALPHLSVMSAEPDFALQQIAQLIGASVTVGERSGLEATLGRLLREADAGAAATPRTLDLIGHTRTHASLLALGDWLIDGEDPVTIAVFRRLAEHDVLRRLGVHTVRLLGCHSAVTAHGQATICRLADLLGLEVQGANQPLHAGHYDAGGFRDCWRFLLVDARDLRGRSASASMAPRDGTQPRVLDLEALPAVMLGTHAAPYPRCIATAPAARQILQLVRHRDGAPMPGPQVTPTAELALPSTRPGIYHVAHVLLDGAFLRFYPDGMTRTGILFPVDNASALRRIVATLPQVPGLSHS